MRKLRSDNFLSLKKKTLVLVAAFIFGLFLLIAPSPRFVHADFSDENENNDEKFRPSDFVFRNLVTIASFSTKQISGINSGMEKITRNVIIAPKLVYRNLTATIFSPFKLISNLNNRIESKLGDAYLKTISYIIPGYSVNIINQQPQVYRLPEIQEIIIKEIVKESIVQTPPTETIIRQEIEKITETEHITEVTKVTEIIKETDITQIQQDISEQSDRITGVESQSAQLMSMLNSIRTSDNYVSTPRVFNESGDLIFRAHGGGSIFISADNGLQLSGGQIILDASGDTNTTPYITVKDILSIDNANIQQTGSTLTNTFEGALTVSGSTSLSSLTTTGTATLNTLNLTNQLAIAYGGTNATNATDARTTLGLAIGTDVQAYNAYLADISGITANQGDIIYFDGANWIDLAPGSSGQFLKTQGTGANPIWDSVGGGGDMLGSNNLSELTSTSTARTTLGLAIGTDVQAYDADLTTYAGITPSANIQTFLGSADYAAARTNLSLTIGTNVQAYDATLQSLSGLASAADLIPYFTGSGTAATTTITSFGRSLIDDANNTTARTTLGLAIGTDVQSYSSLLADIAALSTADSNFIVGNGSTWVAETGTTARTSLSLGTGDSPTFTGLTLSGLTNGSLLFATSSGVISQSNSDLFWDSVNGRMGIGTTTPAAKLHALSATEQLRLGYNNTNYAQFTIDANGDLTIVPTGGDINLGNATTSTVTIAGNFSIDSNSVLYNASTGMLTINSMRTGGQRFEDNAGVVSWIDMAVGSSTAGTVQSYSAQIDNNAILTVYAEMDGAGGIQNSRVGIGTASPGYRLQVEGDAASSYIARIYNTNTANTADGLLISLGVANASRGTGNYFIGFSTADQTVAGKIQGGASAVAYTTGSADFAEYYLASDQDNLPESGDLVSLDPLKAKAVKKSFGDKNLLVGVVSTNPGFIGNGPICLVDEKNCDENYAKYNVLVSLAGQVPVKVSAENGPINIGDPLTSSPVEGVAMKASHAGKIIGYALENYNGTEIGKIQFFINLGRWEPETDEINGNNQLSIEENGNGQLVLKKINSRGIEFASGETIFVNNEGYVEIKELTVQKIEIKEGIKIGDPDKRIGITIYDENTGEPYCMKIKNGAVVGILGECVYFSSTSSAVEPVSAENLDFSADTEEPIVNTEEPAEESTIDDEPTDEPAIDEEPTATEEPTEEPTIAEELIENEEPAAETETSEEN